MKISLLLLVLSILGGCAYSGYTPSYIISDGQQESSLEEKVR